MGGSQGPEDLPPDMTLEAAPDLLVRLALGQAPVDVGPGFWVGAHPGEHDRVERPVEPAVPAAVEPVPHSVARGRRDRTGARDLREGGLAADAPRGATRP